MNCSFCAGICHAVHFCSGICLSVQFQVPLDHYLHHEVASDQEEETAEKSLEESMEEITEVQKRVLDQWCFAEHFQPEVLLQVCVYVDASAVVCGYMCLCMII